jgi:hypothetical protein
MPIIRQSTEDYHLIEEQGERVLREYLTNVLGYPKGGIVEKIKPRYIFNFALKNNSKFVLRYEKKI